MNSPHPLDILDMPHYVAHSQLQPPLDYYVMPPVKQCFSAPSPPCPAALSKRALLLFAQALVAHERLSYAELLSVSSVSHVNRVVRQVRELLRVDLSQWHEWMEEAAESHSDGAETELPSETSSSSSPSSTSSDLTSPLSASSLPDFPASPASPVSVASSRSPSPPPNPRRTLTIVTRANGKRPHPSSAAARHQSTTSNSNSTTYMTAAEFITYFQRSRSLSEAVKSITHDYPSYREVSIYARARRLECRFDHKGKFYQPTKKAKRKAAVMSSRNSADTTFDNGAAMDEEESDQHDEDDEDEQEEEEDDREDITAAKKKRTKRHGRHRKSRRVEWAEDEDDEDDEDDESSSDDDNDLQSESSCLSSSGGSSSGSDWSSSASMSELNKPTTGADITQPPATDSAPDALDALQLLATSAGSSPLHAATPAGQKNSDTVAHKTAHSTFSALSKPVLSSTPAEQRTNKSAALRRPVDARIQALIPHQAASSSLTRGSLRASSPVRRPVQSLPVGVYSAVNPFHSSAALPPAGGACGYGQLPVSPTMRPVFGPSCAFPPRGPPYLASQFVSASAMPYMPPWPFCVSVACFICCQ